MQLIILAKENFEVIDNREFKTEDFNIVNIDHYIEVLSYVIKQSVIML